MYRVDFYARVRRACRVEGMSTREASRVFGLDRKMVRKVLSFSVPPGYRRDKPPRRPKLGPFTGIIDRILEDDRTSHHKQRYTAKRIFDRLREEYGFTGGYTLHALARNPEMTRRRTLAHPVPAGETDLPIQFHGMHAPVRELGSLFDASLTATAIRLVESRHSPTLLVCHGHEGRKWFARSTDVPERWFPRDNLDSESFAFDLLFGQGTFGDSSRSARASG